MAGAALGVKPLSKEAMRLKSKHPDSAEKGRTAWQNGKTVKRERNIRLWREPRDSISEKSDYRLSMMVNFVTVVREK